MKSVVLVFLAVAGFLIGWTYASREAKGLIGGIVRKNILQIMAAIAVVVVAIAFSSNITLRLI